MTPQGSPVAAFANRRRGLKPDDLSLSCAVARVAVSGCRRRCRSAIGARKPSSQACAAMLWSRSGSLIGRWAASPSTPESRPSSPRRCDQATSSSSAKLAVHKSAKGAAILKTRGAWFLFLPIEMAFAKRKVPLRAAAARTFDALWRAYRRHLRPCSARKNALNILPKAEYALE